MWLITNFGFFSVVEKPEDKGTDKLTIRSRVKADLEAIRDRYLPEMGKITPNAGSDYKYRARVSREALARAAGQIVRDVNYSNFKNSVCQEQGHDREKVYHKVWDALYQLQGNEAQFIVHERPAPSASVAGPPLKKAYGGVLFDNQGQVLLRKPKNEYDGYVWTFAKGKADPKETPEQTALREVLEETGYSATILGEVPGSFRGGTTDNRYYLMQPLREPQSFGLETEEIKWVSVGEARTYIAKTQNEVGRQRDLAVLEAAIAEYQRLQAK